MNNIIFLLLLVALQGRELHGVSCPYGELPGSFFSLSNESIAGERYQILDSECQLENKLLKVPDLPQLSVLFLGDSVDWFIMETACLTHIKGETPIQRIDRFHSFNYCVPPKGEKGVKLGQMYLPGVHPTGPYFLMEQKPNTLERIPLAISEFKKKQHVSRIDCIVLSSNLWDLARLCKVENNTSCQGLFLDKEFIEGWMQNLTRVIEAVREESKPSEPMLIFHTTAMPHTDCETGRVTMKDYLGSSEYVHQLNEAGRLVARREGLQIIDLSRMTQGLGTRHRLQDVVHIQPMIRQEIFNLILNVMGE
jgi:hypothetical protein